MIVYNASKGQFVRDVKSNVIASKILDLIRARGFNAGQDREFASWQNSMQFMRNIVDDSDIDDEVQIAIEYNIPQTSKRVDFIIIGADEKNIDNIVRMQSIRRVPKVQSFIKGVINLRGEVLPVMSLRITMGLSDDEITGKSRIIILKAEQGNVGVLVDEVKKVVTIYDNDIERISHDSKSGLQSFISGVGKVEGGLISLLDLNMVIGEVD